jgi:hypothetical protein
VRNPYDKGTADKYSKRAKTQLCKPQGAEKTGQDFYVTILKFLWLGAKHFSAFICRFIFIISATPARFLNRKSVSFSGTF